MLIPPGEVERMVGEQRERNTQPSREAHNKES